MQVIDIPSSPEPPGSSMTRRTRSASPQPGPSKKRPRLAAPDPSVVEIIELSDSDTELPARTSPKNTRQPRHPHPPLATAPVFGPPNSDMLADAPASALGSPQRVVRRGNGDPLFLPGSDDEQRGARPPPAPAAQDGHNAVPAGPRPLPFEPAVPPSAPVDPVDEYVASVLEIVPDVQPAHVLALIEQSLQAQPANVVELVLHTLFENPSYPKIDKKGKHKLDDADSDPDKRGSSRPKVDYTSKGRLYSCGPYYFDCSLEQLAIDFPRIPKAHIRSRLISNRFYAPTYFLLEEELNERPLPFKLKSTSFVASKGKAKQDPDFDKEREWLLLKVAELATEKDAVLAASVNEQEYKDNGQGIECGCCFSEYPFDQMIQCPEAHLFCKSCMTSYASNLLGEHNPNIVCMDQSGCKLPFPESELARFLSSKLLELYYRVKQRNEIEAAGLANLEECPFCEYKCVIENEMEKLFRCESAGCGAITCRACKKPDHLPKTCKEVDQDKHLDAQHVIEEAMTQARMRNCPKCQKSFIKEMGCNKMTCPNCHTVSCYICRKIINGYDHFSNPPPYSGKVNTSKCNLWDPIEQRHAEEVTEAAKRALAELRKSQPDVDAANLKVDLPVAGPPARPGLPNQAVPGLNVAAGWPGHAGAAAAGRVEVPVGAGGVRWGAGAGAGGNNLFRFGDDLAHAFVPPAVVAPRLVFDHDPPVHAGGPAVPEPAIPLPLALTRGRRAPQARLPVQPLAQPQPQPVMPAGGGGRRRKGR